MTHTHTHTHTYTHTHVYTNTQKGTTQEVLASSDDDQIPRFTSILNMSYVLYDPDLTPDWVPDYEEMIVRAAEALCVGSRSLDAGVRAASVFDARKGVAPSRGMLEALRSMLFCLVQQCARYCV